MSWISNIADTISKAFEKIRPPLQSIPPILLVCEAAQRPGLSAISLTSSIIQRMPESNIETNINIDGEPNKINKFIRIVCEETLKELKDNGLITCVIEPLTVNSVGTGANAMGPVAVTSSNTAPINIMGIIQ